MDRGTREAEIMGVILIAFLLHPTEQLFYPGADKLLQLIDLLAHILFLVTRDILKTFEQIRKDSFFSKILYPELINLFLCIGTKLSGFFQKHFYIMKHI